MTEQKTPSAGEPVEEPTVVVDDVVGNANEALADAEAAQRTATGEQDVAAERVVEQDVVVVETPTPDGERVVEEVVVTEAAADQTRADDDVPWYDRPETVPMDPEPAATTAIPSAAAPVAEPEPTYAAAAAQPIFVQAPEAPRPRGNRGAAGAIGLLAALAFAVLSFGVLFAYGYFYGGFGGADADAADYALALIRSWTFWMPVVVFYLGFWILGAILNRARWAHWVIWGLLVGVAAYAGSLLGILFQAPFWELTARQGADLLQGSLFSPLPILAFVLGRELTVWFGAWVAARGRRVTALNDEAQREYERTLEAGPQLHQV
ncbi:ABC transporter [Microbacterium sp. CIAB417]|uniref:ABC transporter n=1 Tax=Microbacterium sp. CIAB417 TaxID=2860287 RepID=UPI001FAD95B4|nr:ABC transporter [Microbacterium sp. CIAB417]